MRYLVLLVTLFCALVVQATSFIWIGGGEDGKWSNGLNWKTSAGKISATAYPKATGDIANFTSESGLGSGNDITVTLDADRSIRAVLVNRADTDGGGDVIINGEKTLSLTQASYTYPVLENLNTATGWLILNCKVALKTTGRFSYGVKINGDFTVGYGLTILRRTGATAPTEYTADAACNIVFGSKVANGKGLSLQGSYSALIVDAEGTSQSFGAVTLYGTNHLIMNGGTMTVTSIAMNSSSADRSVIEINGGSLAVNQKLTDNTKGDAKCAILRVNGGKFSVASSDASSASVNFPIPDTVTSGMQIDVTGGEIYAPKGILTCKSSNTLGHFRQTGGKVTVKEVSSDADIWYPEGEFQIKGGEFRTLSIPSVDTSAMTAGVKELYDYLANDEVKGRKVALGCTDMDLNTSDLIVNGDNEVVVVNNLILYGDGTKPGDIDLNGGTLIVSNKFEQSAVTKDKFTTVQVRNGGFASFAAPTGVKVPSANGYFHFIVEADSKIEVPRSTKKSNVGGFYLYGNSDLVINGGVFRAPQAYFGTITDGDGAKATLTLNGGVFNVGYLDTSAVLSAYNVSSGAAEFVKENILPSNSDFKPFYDALAKSDYRLTMCQPATLENLEMEINGRLELTNSTHEAGLQVQGSTFSGSGQILADWFQNTTTSDSYFKGLQLVPYGYYTTTGGKGIEGVTGNDVFHFENVKFGGGRSWRQKDSDESALTLSGVTVFNSNEFEGDGEVTIAINNLAAEGSSPMIFKRGKNHPTNINLPNDAATKFKIVETTFDDDKEILDVPSGGYDAKLYGIDRDPKLYLKVTVEGKGSVILSNTGWDDCEAYTRDWPKIQNESELLNLRIENGDLIADSKDASSTKWTGAAGNGDWFDPANWDGGVVPNDAGVAVDISGITDDLVFTLTNDVLVGEIALSSTHTVKFVSDSVQRTLTVRSRLSNRLEIDNIKLVMPASVSRVSLKSFKATNSVIDFGDNESASVKSFIDKITDYEVTYCTFLTTRSLNSASSDDEAFFNHIKTDSSNWLISSETIGLTAGHALAIKGNLVCTNESQLGRALVNTDGSAVLQGSGAMAVNYLDGCNIGTRELTISNTKLVIGPSKDDRGIFNFRGGQLTLQNATLGAFANWRQGNDETIYVIGSLTIDTVDYFDGLTPRTISLKNLKPYGGDATIKLIGNGRVRLPSDIYAYFTITQESGVEVVLSDDLDNNVAYWTGKGGNNKWSNADNWDCDSGYPDGLLTVVNLGKDDTSGSINIELDVSVAVDSLEVPDGWDVAITVDNGKSLSVREELANRGTLSVSGNGEFTLNDLLMGEGATMTVGTSSFRQLGLSDTAEALIYPPSITVDENLKSAVFANGVNVDTYPMFKPFITQLEYTDYTLDAGGAVTFPSSYEGTLELNGTLICTNLAHTGEVKMLVNVDGSGTVIADTLNTRSQGTSNSIGGLKFTLNGSSGASAYFIDNGNTTFTDTEFAFTSDGDFNRNPLYNVIYNGEVKVDTGYNYLTFQGTPKGGTKTGLDHDKPVIHVTKGYERNVLRAPVITEVDFVFDDILTSLRVFGVYQEHVKRALRLIIR